MLKTRLKFAKMVQRVGHQKTVVAIAAEPAFRVRQVTDVSGLVLRIDVHAFARPNIMTEHLGVAGHLDLEHVSPNVLLILLEKPQNVIAVYGRAAIKTVVR